MAQCYYEMTESFNERSEEGKGKEKCCILMCVGVAEM